MAFKEFFESISVWGWLDLGFTLMVLVGVAGESDKIARFVARCLVKDKTQLGFKMICEWGANKVKHFAEYFVILGIAGELVCLGFTFREGFEQALKIKEANVSVEALRKENLGLQIQLTKVNESIEPRTVGEQGSFSRSLKRFPSIQVRIRKALDTDSITLSGLLSATFLMAQWDVVFDPAPVIGGDVGIEIEHSWPIGFGDNSSVSEKAAFELLNILTERKIAAHIGSAGEAIPTNVIKIRINGKPGLSQNKIILLRAREQFLTHLLGHSTLSGHDLEVKQTELKETESDLRKLQNDLVKETVRASQPASKPAAK